MARQGKPQHTGHTRFKIRIYRSNVDHRREMYYISWQGNACKRTFSFFLLPTPALIIAFRQALPLAKSQTDQRS